MKRQKGILMVMLCIIGMLLGHQDIYAADKQMQVELDKDYTSCVFKLVFDAGGEYEASLSDANDNTYEFATLDDTTMTCSLDKVQAGTYTVNISSEQKEEIGKVTLSVSTNKVSTTDIVNDNIMVGKDISGLKMYFKDDTFIAKWTDETCGAVDVKVVNLDTAETLKSEKVTDKDFECQLPEYVQRISVSIVPSSSSNIAGAELTYTFDTKNEPDATVTPPDFTKTNADKVAVKIALGDTYGVYVEDNGECVLTTDLMVRGNYDIEIPLSKDGQNDILFFIVDADGNMRSTHFAVNKDTTPPTLSLNEEYDGMEVNEQSFVIAGTVANYSTFQINDTDVDVATDGYFEYNCDLHWGDNKIHLQAEDDAGNVTQYDVVIKAVEKKSTGIDPTSVAIFVAVLIVIFSVIKKGRSKKTTPDDKSNKSNDESEMFIANEETEEGCDNNKFDTNVPEDMTNQKASDKCRWWKRNKERNKEASGEMGKGGTIARWFHKERNRATDENQCNAEGDKVNETDLYAAEEGDTEAYMEALDLHESVDSDKMGYIGAADDTEMLSTDQKEEINEQEDDGNKKDILKSDTQKRETPSMLFPQNNPRQVPNFRETEFIGTVPERVRKSKTNEFGENFIEQKNIEWEDTEKKNTEKKITDQEETEQEKHMHEHGVCERPKENTPASTVINVIVDDDTQLHSGKKKRKNIVGEFIYMAIIVAMVYAVFHIVLLNGYISSSSMEPTLKTGDLTISNRLAYLKQSPQRGDVISFMRDNEYICKRVIGIAGDEITFSDGNIFINGEVLDESWYLKNAETFVPDDGNAVYVVPEGKVFVLGDNRENSEDSRYWKQPYLSVSDIKGKLMFIIPTHVVFEEKQMSPSENDNAL